MVRLTAVGMGVTTVGVVALNLVRNQRNYAVTVRTFEIAVEKKYQFVHDRDSNVSCCQCPFLFKEAKGIARYQFELGCTLPSLK